MKHFSVLLYYIIVVIRTLKHIKNKNKMAKRNINFSFFHYNLYHVLINLESVNKLTILVYTK